MSLCNLFQRVEEARKLLFGRALAPVLVFEQRLHEGREVRVEVARLGRAEGRVQYILRGFRQQRGHVGAWLDEELRPNIGDVVEQEDGAERWTLVRARQGRKAGDDGIDDIDYAEVNGLTRILRRLATHMYSARAPSARQSRLSSALYRLARLRPSSSCRLRG